MLKTLIKQIGSFKTASILTPIFIALEVVMGVLIPYVTSWIIDEGIAQNDLPDVYKYGAIMLVLATMSMIFGILAGRFSAMASSGFARNLRDAMFRNIQTFSFSNIDKFSSSGLVTRMTTDVNNLQNAFQMLLRISVRAPLNLIFSIFMCVFINTQMSIIFIIALVILGTALFLIIRRTVKLFTQVFKKYDDLNNVVQENVSAIRVVKAFVREDYENKKFSKAARSLYGLFVKTEKLMALNHPVMMIVVYGCIISLSWFGAKQIVGSSLTTGQLTSLFTYVMTILSALMMLSMIFVQLTMSAASGKRVAEVINEKADIVNPEMKTYEKNALLEYSDNISAQLLIGAAKQSRNTYSGSNAQQIGNSLAGPMLYPYVNWVVQNALGRKIEKLLFIARDGYILKKIADIIIEVNQYDIKTEYVYGSRRAWRMPSYKSSDSLDIFFRMAHLDQLADVESLSSIFNLSFDELAPYLPARFNNRKLKLHGKDYDVIKDELEKNSNFKIFMEELAITEADKVVDYFDEIIGNSTFAFVELSGSGITQNCLSKLLGEKYEQVIITYFLNLYGAEDDDKSLFINYLPNKLYNGWIIENLCRAPHGQTEGYRRDGSHVEPILSKSEEAQALIKHGFYDYSYGCVQYAKKFEKNTKGMSNVKVDPVLFIKYLKHIVYNPSLEIKEFIGDMPFETTGFNDKLTVYAPVLTRQQIENIYLKKYSDERIDSFYDGASLDFSLKRLSDEDREYVCYCESIVNTRHGQIERIKRRIKENGLINTAKFIKGRLIRSLLVKTGKINYK